MGFIEKLNKYGKKISINKTDIYKKIEEAKLPLEAMGLNMKIKDEFDLFDYEIIYNGMLAQNYIENTYEMFLTQHYDLMDYLNYEEKRKMFNNDIVSILKRCPHFFDEKSQNEIYIPYLEAFVNQRYINDYQLMMLKQHREYVKTYKVNQKTPMELYGERIYQTGFSSLKNVYEDERHLCLYYDELKTIYIFRKDQKELLNKVIVVDGDFQENVELEDIKAIAYDIENYLYKECLDLMKEKKYISEKTYKKVLKKYQ